MIQLYNYYRSSASYRVRIALNLKGLPYEAIPVHLINQGGEQHLPAYQAINPQRLVPTLLTDAAQPVSQSLAILEYLEEQYPVPALLPKDTYQRAQVRAFALAIVADIHPLNNLRVLQYLSKELQCTEEQKATWYQHWITTGFAALEAQLVNNQTTGDFCFGNTPTLADVCLIPQVYNARRYACDLSAYPTLVRIDAHCQQHPAFVEASPQEATT